jgi:hypothetical protein
MISPRAELYKTYLMYSMSGDVVELPVGGVIRKKTNLAARQAEMTRLQQLGDLLGMNQLEVAAVHNDLAEQAYRNQAQEVLRGTGTLSPERKEYLDQMRQQLGLQQATADKIIREVGGGGLGFLGGGGGFSVDGGGGGRGMLFLTTVLLQGGGMGGGVLHQGAGTQGLGWVVVFWAPGCLQQCRAVASILLVLLLLAFLHATCSASTYR